MRAVLIWASALTGLLASVACSEPGGPLELGRARQAIIDGYASGVEDDAVVRLFGERGCTGTLVAPNLVVTALHCVSNLTGDGAFECNTDGTLENPPNGLLGQPYAPESISIVVGADFSQQSAAVGQTILSTRATDICQRDLAFLILDRSIDDLPIAPVRLDAVVERYERVSVVGYGLTDFPPPPGSLAERRRRDDVRVEAIGRLDDDEADDAVYYARPNTFALGESVCMGDSGGPALSASGAVLGVYSTNVAGCRGDSSRNFFTMLSQFRPLVLDAFEQAGATPFLEGQRRPGVWPDAGAPGSQPDEPPPSEGGQPGLDAGPLQTLDGQDEPVVETPRVIDDQRRVDSGFCGLSPRASRATRPGQDRSLTGPLLLLCALGWRRRRRV